MDLHTAAENGDLDTVRTLLLQSDYSPHAKSLAEDVAIDNGHREIADYIYCYHSKERKELYSASLNGDPGKIEELLSCYDYDPSTMNVALAESAAADSVEAIKHLIAKGADPRWGEDQPLIIAAEAGSTQALGFLLSIGADPDAQEGYALISAAKNGHLGTLVYLLSKKDYTYTDKGYTLTVAAKEGHIQVVRYLLTQEYCLEGNITAHDPLIAELLHDMLPNTEILQGIEDTIDDLEFQRSMIAHFLLEDMGEDPVNTITRYY